MKIHSATSDAGSVRIRISGPLSHDHLADLEKLIEAATTAGIRLLLDLQRVTVVDQSAVRYLAQGEGSKFELVSCPTFIRQWVQQENEAMSEHLAA